MGDGGHRPQARPFGSSGLAAALGIGVFFLALIVAGVLVLGGDDDGDGSEFALGTGTPTAEAQQDTANPQPDSTPTAEQAAQSSPTASESSPTPRVFPTLTPSATLPPDEEAVDATATPLPDDEPVDEPTEVIDETEVDPTDVPEEPVEIPPTPVEEPFVGEFGFLAPPQLPSGGAGQSLELDYQLGTSLELVPTSATVYQVEWPAYSEDEVATMAANLGVDGSVTSGGDGVFTVDGSASTLFVAPTIIEYSAVSSGAGAELPSAGVAVDAAWSWFSALGIGGVPAGDASVVAVEEAAGLSVVAITPSYPAPNLSPTPSARIKVSASGTVEEARVVWPWSLTESEYGLRPALALWEDLRAGHAFVSADLSESGGGYGSMTITDISLSYTVAGSPWESQYIVPLVVFGGTATVNGVEVWVSAYVPAVYHQANALG